MAEAKPAADAEKKEEAEAPYDGEMKQIKASLYVQRMFSDLC
jgi:hypothetical protein